MPKKTKTDRKAQILEGMLEALATRGYQRSSIQQIARHADITPGLIHYHFSSKQALLIGALELLEARLRERLATASAPAHGELAMTRAWIDAHTSMDNGQDLRALRAWVAISAEAVWEEEVQHVFQAALARDTAALDDALSQDAPELTEDARARICATLVSAVQGAYVLGTSAPEIIPTGSMSAQLSEVARALVTSHLHTP